MKKLTLLTIATVATLGMTAANAQDLTQNYYDNLIVNLKNMPANGAVHVDYTKDNDTYFTLKPADIPAGASSFKAQIHSNNQVEDGYPTMSVNVPATGAHCTLGLSDGPYDYLAFKNGAPPVCAHFKVSSILETSAHNYTVSMTYQ